MCGIIGYTGRLQAAPIVLDGLKKLEYRGYDSAGVAVINQNKIESKKTKGKLEVLDRATNGGELLTGTTGIGHTRWATHGAPTEHNSHPHFSQDGHFAVVHNGIIENYLQLKKMLTENGVTFVSETDTEVVPQLMQFYYNGNVLETFQKVVGMLEGAYALGLISTYEPETLFAARKDSPLIVGLGENENFIASDIPAILAYTRDVYLLDEGEFAVLTKDNVQVISQHNNLVKKQVFHVNWDVSSAEKGGYEYYMLKEIMEQPKAVRETILPRLSGDRIVMDELSFPETYYKQLKKIFIVACGSAYHVGLVGKYMIEDIARVPVDVDLASEFRYRNPIIAPDDLVIIVSQSGETLDTLAALRDAKRQGAKILSIVNVKGSSIARESDEVLYTHAGPEIAVATTKAYSTQMECLFLFGLYLAKMKGKLTEENMATFVDELKALPEKIETVVKNDALPKEIARKFKNVHDVFFIGRGLDYAIALEGSLKLKEISYIHSEAYAAGELKHGTISLIEDGTLVVALATQEHLFDKMLSNIKEVKARGAYVLAIALEGNTEVEKEADHVIYLPKTIREFTGALEVLPLQLLSYYISLYKGLDVDKPRNLAKSVTVE